MYKKRGNCRSLDEYAVEQTGLTVAWLNTFQSSYVIKDLDKVADRILKAKREGEKVAVYADYDADGITSAAQFFILFNTLGITNRNIYIPHRFSDGYGLNSRYVSNLGKEKGLLITVDNGITAYKSIQEAKALGWDVIVMDHHEGTFGDDKNIILPEADILVDPDPKALPDGSDYHHYCGAGLTYKLIQMILDKGPVVEQASAFAAIGTVADIVDLTGDNRKIVKDGLSVINNGDNIPTGLRKLLEIMKLDGHLDAKGIGFSIGPCINAAGRLYDAGGQGILSTLLIENEENAVVYARKMVDINDMRKQMKKEILETVEIDPADKINFVRISGSKGLAGLIASDIIKETPRPTFVYTEENGICYGSSRSDDEDKNDVKAMLDSVGDLLISHGGHKGAAGFSFRKEDEEAVAEKLRRYNVVPHDEEKYYDLGLIPERATQALCMLDTAEPFGKGFPRPKFRIECHFENIEYWNSMGKDGSHLRFDLPGGTKAVFFSGKEKFMEMGCPRHLNMYGELEWNWWNGNCSPNFQVEDIEANS